MSDWKRQKRKAAREKGQVAFQPSSKTKLARKESHRKRDQRRRADIIKRLGSACEKCGLSDFRCLQFHHINGGGTKERRSLMRNYIRAMWVMPIEELREKFQLLCANCHAIVTYEQLYGHPKSSI